MADRVPNHTILWCRACLGHFHNENSFNVHKLYCQGIDDSGQIFVLPDPRKKVRFENLSFCAKAPFIIYADFEALVKSTGRTHGERVHTSFDYETQNPCSVGYVVLSVFPDFQRAYKSYSGEDCVRWFLEEMVAVESQATEH